MFDYAYEELAQLNRHWQSGDVPALKAALHDYHERRKQRVPRIVAALNDLSDHPH